MANKNFERSIPNNYELVKTINATSKRIGIILNLVASAIFLIVLIIAAIPIILSNTPIVSDNLMLGFLVFILGIIAYIILHEAVHGIAYKLLTGEKLTFGLKWSCAFCGIPNIFVYRKTALIAVLAPLTVFTILFIPLIIGAYFVDPLLYFAVICIFGQHLGGCCGDMYVAYLLLFKYKDNATLMNDTGPVQRFYIPKNN